jgi:hypothetical protein
LVLSPTKRLTAILETNKGKNPKLNTHNPKLKKLLIPNSILSNQEFSPTSGRQQL